MNNQFATQFLREDREEVSAYLDSADQLVATLQPAIEKAIAANMSKEEILDIIDNILRLNEDGAAAAPAGGGGSTTGGGVTNGASFTPGAGEQYAAGTRRKKMEEDEEDDAGPQICIPFEILDPVINAWPVDRQTALTALAKKYNIDVKFGKYGNNPVWYSKEEVAENAPMLAHGKANISTYTKDGFTKAPDAEEAGKNIQGVDVEMLWKEGAEKKSLSPEAIKIIQDFTNRNIESHLRGDFKQEVAKDLASDIFNAKSTINDLKRFLEDKAAFFGERYVENLNESRAYSRFKKETATRSESERMHEAAKMINSRLEEISKILEFTRQMREELSEGEETLEYKHNTKKVFEKINKKVIEVYSKTKKLG